MSIYTIYYYTYFINKWRVKMGSSFKNPTEAAKAIIKIAQMKEKSTIVTTILLSFLAGAYIAFGGLLAEIVTGGMATAGFPPGLVKLLFASVFPVGLILVVLAGSELFTGNNMYMVVGVLSGKTTLKGLTRNWALSWIFNFVGALFVAYVLAYLSGIITSDPAFTASAIKIAVGKTKITWFAALIRGIGCNWLVCLAVYLGLTSDDVVGKIIGLWFPVMAFVAIGFEHCIANMFFLPLAMFLGGGITWLQVIINLIPVTIGNIIGGGFFVGAIYWYTYLYNGKKEIE
jgi:formate/nitrite transporter